jgi:hypothetical protein
MLKWDSNHLSVHGRSARITVGKPHFDPFRTPFHARSDPFSRVFGTLRGSKMVPVDSNRPQITHLNIPQGPGSLLKKCIFDSFWTLFQDQNDPFSMVLGPFRRSKTAQTGSNWPEITRLSIPSDPGSLLKKPVSHPFWTQLGPILAAYTALGLFPDCAVGAMGEPRPD